MGWTYDEYGNEVWEEDEPAGPPPGYLDPTRPPETSLPTAGGNGGGSEPPTASTGGGADTQRKLNELLNAGYNGPTDPASVDAAYNRTVNGGSASIGTGGTGNTGGGGPGILTGYENVALQQTILNSQAAIALGQARLAFDRDRMQAVEIPTMENMNRYRDSQIRLQEAEETFRRELDRLKFEFEQKKFAETLGEQQRQFDTTTAMDVWSGQRAQADQYAQNTGLYAPPASSPTLPGYSIRQMFDKDVKSYLGREPTLQEYQQWLMWGQNSREPRPQRPQDRLGPLSGMPQPTAGNAAPYPSPAPGVPGGSTLQEVRAAAEKDIGRAMSEPEWRTYLSGRFDPEHPHVKSGQAQAGQVLGPEYSRPWDVHRAKLPTAWQETYRANTGQEPGQYQPQAPKPTAAAAPAPSAPTPALVGTPDPTGGIPDVMDEETRRRLRQAALAAA